MVAIKGGRRCFLMLAGVLLAVATLLLLVSTSLFGPAHQGPRVAPPPLTLFPLGDKLDRRHPEDF